MEGERNANSGEARRDAGGRDGAPQEQPIFPTLDDLRDLPQRLLPEETVTHLKNAGREALLALYHLWRSIDSARDGQPGDKVRKRIDVE